MNIETKYNVNDLVQHKYQKAFGAKRKSAFEVIEIVTNSCYAGSQVFYKCRMIHSVTEERLSDIYEIVDFGPTGTSNGEYVEFREDELKPCEETLALQIKNIGQ